MSSLKKILGLKKQSKKSKKLGIAPPPYEEDATMEFAPSAPLNESYFGMEDMDFHDKRQLRYEKFHFSIKLTVQSNRPFRSCEDAMIAVSNWDHMYIGLAGKRPFYKVLALLGSTLLKATPAVLADQGHPEYHAFCEGRAYLPHRLGPTPPMLNVPEHFRRPFHIGLYRGTVDLTLTLYDDESTESAPVIWDYINSSRVKNLRENALMFGLIVERKATGSWVLDSISHFK
ncbi:matrix protein [Vesicular stomatitis Alagoas virus]|uniref:Matrix protein n=1 Tax=Vesicular stomatitis Alagoas virus TaxID=198833 RepID=B3FRL3_9RHAB|nr:matrix protein [Vesicular stomatitis Alagoas virus]ACB47441.1 matrix protein [Vesicular stomatitis Alagoas virus]AYO51728.1 matrix protein [Vesicular stomatitis virus]